MITKTSDFCQIMLEKTVVKDAYSAQKIKKAEITRLKCTLRSNILVIIILTSSCDILTFKLGCKTKLFLDSSDVIKLLNDKNQYKSRPNPALVVRSVSKSNEFVQKRDQRKTYPTYTTLIQFIICPRKAVFSPSDKHDGTRSPS